MRLNIKINLDNDAFQDGNLMRELQQIFNSICNETHDACIFDESFVRFFKKLRDTNGNVVGKAVVSTLSPSDIS